MQILPLINIPNIVYHGTTTQHYESLQRINVGIGRKELDFGQGFYTTSVKRQADEWARGKVFRGHRPLILTYEVDVDSIKSMEGIFFKNASEEWVKFIFQHRMELYDLENNKYDYVYGHMADGKIPLILEKCKNGLMTYTDFKENIYPTNCPIFYYDQLFFRTERSITALHRINEEVL